MQRTVVTKLLGFQLLPDGSSITGQAFSQVLSSTMVSLQLIVHKAREIGDFDLFLG